MQELLRSVAEADKDRYLSLLFCPAPQQNQLAALYAFDIELAKIKRLVTEPQLGQIRLQWWRESLANVYAGSVGGPALLAALVELRQRVPFSVLESMLDAAEAAILDERPASLLELETWLGKSSSLVMQAAMLILGGSAPDVCGLAGVAYGLSRRLAQGERWLVPQDWEVGKSEEERIRTLAQHASDRLREARVLRLERKLLPAVLPAAVTPLYVSQVMRHPLAPMQVSPLRRQLAIWWSAKRERF